MKILAGLHRFPSDMGCVATIGNFDGVHLGHQAILKRLQQKARELNLPSVVLTFEPQPAEFFLGKDTLARLSTFREKVEIFSRFGIDYICRLKFNSEMAAMSAETFAKKYLLDLLQLRYLTVGNDFQFGANRQGNALLLNDYFKAQGRELEIFPDFEMNGKRVSSTRIRKLLKEGRLTQAASLLGRTYSISGRVVVGNRQGCKWGIPTANIALNRKIPPFTGVFCVEVKRNNGKIYHGVANLGIRPTVDGTKTVLEVHLLNFQENLYSERLQVFFLHKLRDEIKFPNLEELIQQIRNDIVAAERYFSNSRLNLTLLAE
ncbi:riboflavin biosynthesis protein RibF (riboflavin kinase/FMN adenylyltransferase) [Legionella quinlivanii]|uniref:Riboflavin biosynthesis protein n=1 Tax=Legionella quinlivanii TaxID=45073 RepID=A0A0W0Y537_9GAMM|nr:bifunctional riboflavin kinase/FAD synthetase [Legionella quinlivanii]KTD51732.1 riboflavin biosynthesis protein RibF (riboflavin kinase/FMN adenylyltransferase) [Legionella quinlivanii]MCW8451069.1 bifunctional riboflavin kinase/FAD synthetase [Legionella quinlivanii]SEF64564.1 riboflavin kinase / FMN adenylyltransferase [Legionella quinlivanii DSM 21216]STY10740.1 riboflavin biosynthesis protein RibF (riboflavin kinase/FMN adenylyltransferase) [Legionella quinlivanii]